MPVRISISSPYDPNLLQELLHDGLPIQETLRLCDLHTEALQGAIEVSSAPQPPA